MKERRRLDHKNLHGYVVEDSSNVRYVGWMDDGRMIVQFRSGSAYVYHGVSRQRAVACCYARSVGEYINRRIKPRFSAARMA